MIENLELRGSGRRGVRFEQKREMKKPEVPQLKRARLRRHTRGAFPGAVRGRSRCTAHLPRSPPLPPPALEESPAPSARRTPSPPAREKHKRYLLERGSREAEALSR
uniref:Uncharacterized protein n=1 Tax=Oryza sativa subsp. japonica TaxID=39947 RepID=Q5Z6A1_ORYSJ|nr:hypothetical protein [Oryza sativa Japonica Group]